MMSLPLWLPGLMFFLGRDLPTGGDLPTKGVLPTRGFLLDLPVVTSSGCNSRGPYASYWNAFLLLLFSLMF